MCTLIFTDNKLGPSGYAALLAAFVDGASLELVDRDYLTESSLKAAGLPLELANDVDGFKAYITELGAAGGGSGEGPQAAIDVLGFTLVLVGHGAAGKSTLLKRLLSGEFVPELAYTNGLSIGKRGNNATTPQCSLSARCSLTLAPFHA